MVAGQKECLQLRQNSSAFFVGVTTKAVQECYFLYPCSFCCNVYGFACYLFLVKPRDSWIESPTFILLTAKKQTARPRNATH